MRRVLLAGVVVALAAMSSGCCQFRTFVHSPFGPGTLCDTTNCGGSCGGSCDACGCNPCQSDLAPCGCGPYGCGLFGGLFGCGPRTCRPSGFPYYGTWGFGPTWGCGPAACCEPRCAPGAGLGNACGMTDACNSCGDCGSSCGSSCDSCCDSCSEPCCNSCGSCCGECTCGCCGGPGILLHIFRLFHPNHWIGCGNNCGCGEIYWGDFHGDPPDCCDPCDCRGNFTGCRGGNCGCSPRYSVNNGVPGDSTNAPESEEMDPSRGPEPTKAPVVPSTKKLPNYNGKRPNNYGRMR